MTTTTTNNQGDEPRPTALERQVQTLTAIVKHLTKQNHDLEEQLRQKNAAMDTQEEDQESTSVERRNQEGPEGNNAPSRLKRQDTSRPSITDMVSPHIVAEMQMMKERMDFMMNALRGWVSTDLDDLVHRTDSPFIASVTSFPRPPKSHATGGKLQWIQGPLKSLGVFQDLDAPSKGARWDHVQSLPHHTKGIRKDLVQ